MNNWVRLAITLVVVVLAVVLSIRAFQRSTAAPPVAVPEPGMAVDGEAVYSIPDETPVEVTPESIGDVIHRFRDEVRGRLDGSRTVPPERRDDLLEAAAERLRGLVAYDVDADRAAWEARGASGFPSLTDEMRKQIEDKGSVYSWSSISLDDVQVRDIAVRGRMVEDRSERAGLHRVWSQSKSGPKRLDLPDSVLNAGWDIVEVRLPMRVRDLNGEEFVVLGAIGLTWHPERQMWLPYYNMFYMDRNAMMIAPPL